MSKGMQQRLGIAQALVGSPRLLMLDEPTSALDPVGRRVVRDLLRELRGRDVAVVLSSHLLSEVELVCDRVAILVGGRIVARGTPAELARPRGVEVETGDGVRKLPRRRARGGAGDRGGARVERRAGVRGEPADLDARGRLSRGGGSDMSGAVIVARYALREAVRRRVILVVLVLTVGFLALYALGTTLTFDEVNALAADDQLDDRVLAGSTLLGLAMFTTLFLGARARRVPHARRGARRRRAGLLQPLVVRPVGSTSLLLGRFAGAAVGVRRLRGGRVPRLAADHRDRGRLVAGRPGRARSLGWWRGARDRGAVAAGLGVPVLDRNGIAVFMIFGAGLAPGLLGQIGDALSVKTLEDGGRSDVVAAALRGALPGRARLPDPDVRGPTGVIVQLGPFGGAQEGGPLLWLW